MSKLCRSFKKRILKPGKTFQKLYSLSDSTLVTSPNGKGVIMVGGNYKRKNLRTRN